jgi:hypothetical protein
MKKLLIAAALASGSLLAVQAPAFAQVGSTGFAFSGSETAAVNSPWTNNAPSYRNYAGEPAYYDYYVAPNTVEPHARVIRRHHVAPR